MTLSGIERAKPFGVDAWRNHGDGQRASGRTFGFGGRITAGGNNVARPLEHIAQGLLAGRNATRHRDLGTMQHNVVRQLERRANKANRKRRVEHHKIGADLAGHVVNASHHERVRQEHRLAHTIDAKRLLRVEGRGVFVGGGEHCKGIGRKPPPPLPQQRLNATDLGWEVVGDQQVFHDAAATSSSMTMGSVSVKASM